ncbi:hypothetical protein [Traorella massiliensis]|uniref:hypothetical protein n=1 Tax=Traorella massiliensis TaxID=1903263 RepID=UPI0008F83B99|nr:hypothetical protein [Traorella massiliensis]
MTLLLNVPFAEKDEAKKLKLFKIKLQYDLVFDFINIGWSSNDYLIEKYAEIIPCDIEILPENLLFKR